MALRRNSLLAGIGIAAACLTSPAIADDSSISGRPVTHSPYPFNNYIYDYTNHRDSITIGLGDAPTSNIIIMHPTPWPSYINTTTINITANQGITALESMMTGATSSTAASSSGTSTSTGTDMSSGTSTTGGN